MYILNATRTCIHNSEYIQRITISAKEDAWLICAALSTHEPLMTLGRYYSEEKATDVLMSLFAALGGGAAYYEMPLHSDVEETAKKQDARQKRRGGS